MRNWLCLGCGVDIRATVDELASIGWSVVYEPLAWATCPRCQHEEQEEEDE